MSEYAEQIREHMSHLYEQSGGDTTVCEFCEEPLDDGRPWMRGLDGAGAHNECIEIEVVDDEH